MGLQFQAALVERRQRRAVSDRDEGRVRQRFDDRSGEVSFALFVERGRSLVEKQPVGPRQQRARDRKPLLFAARQPHLPIVGLVEAIDERSQADLFERLAQGVIRKRRPSRRVRDRVAERADRNIRALRQQHQLRIGRLVNFSRTEWPESRDRSEQGGFAGAARSDEQGRFLRHEHQIAQPSELATVGQAQLEFGDFQRRATRRPRDYMRRLGMDGERAREGIVERSQPVDRRAEIGEPDVTVDEKIHRTVDVAESVRGLVELSEVHLFQKIEGCDDDIGNYDGYLAIELVERDEERPHLDDATDGLEDSLEHRCRASDLPILALEQGDLFAVFPDAREVEAKIRLDGLLTEIERRKSSSDELHHAGRKQRVQERDPEQESGDFKIEERDRHAARDAPENDRKGNEVRRRRDDLNGVVVNADVSGIAADADAAYEAAHILGNALVRVVGIIGRERQFVMHRIHQPARRIRGGHPSPPLQDEVGGDVELDHRRGYRRQRQRQEDNEQLVPESDAMAFVGNLDRVAEIILKEVQANAERDLKLVEQDEKDDAGPRVGGLPDDQRTQQGRAYHDRRRRLEERVRDAHHPTYDPETRNRRNGDHEYRGRDRQIAREGILLVRLRPVAQSIYKVGDPEEHGFDREQFRQQLEERRHAQRWQRGESCESRGDAKSDSHPVRFEDADREGDEREDGEAQ